MNDVVPQREPEGVHNFRELRSYPLPGGHQIRRGMVYRSGALELMTEGDAAWFSNEIAVTTILDLRHPDELIPGRSHALEGRVLPLSIFPEHQTQEALIAELNGLYGFGPSPQRYLHYLEVGGDRMAKAFQLFGHDDAYPILVHCTAGKDRTGVLIALVMEVLGASDADIANEYGLSDASIDRLIAYLRESGRQLEGTDAEIRARLSTPPERMAGFIALMRARYGCAADFFASKGVRGDEIDRVRELLTQ